jgi:rubrerythrin
MASNADLLRAQFQDHAWYLEVSTKFFEEGRTEVFAAEHCGRQVVSIEAPDHCAQCGQPVTAVRLIAP